MDYTVSKVIGNYTSDFNKKPLMTKFGKPYINAKVLLKETGEKQIKVIKWDNVEVKVGDVLNGKVEDKEYNGKAYSEMVFPKKDEQQRSELNKFKFTLDKHDFQIKELQETVKKLIKGEKVEMPKSDYPELTKMPDFGENDADNIPF